MNRLSLFFCVALLSAQDETLKVESTLVIVILSARSKAGRPIADLKKKDFAVFEDGAPQVLSVFESHSKGANSLGVAEQRQLQQTGPGQSSVASRGSIEGDRKFLTLLFDLASMGDAEVRRARAAAIRFVQTKMASGDYLSVATLGDTDRTVLDFTADRHRLLEALRQVGGVSGGMRRQFASSVTASGGGASVAENQLNAFSTARRLSALEDATSALGARPRNLVDCGVKPSASIWCAVS